MNTIKLMVSSEDYKCNFEFERRLNIVRGNSGVGKTTLAEIIMQQDIDVLIESTYPIQVVNVTNWRIIMENAVDSIILFDDLSVVETPEFAEVYKTFSIKNNNYFIIIARENISALKSTGRLPYSIIAIYEMKADGVEHWLERIYDKQVSSLVSVEHCLVEDTKAELEGSVGVNVLGGEVGVSGSVSVGIGAHADVGYKDGKFQFDVGESLGVGASAGMEVDVGGMVDTVYDTAESAWSGLKKGGKP